MLLIEKNLLEEGETIESVIDKYSNINVLEDLLKKNCVLDMERTIYLNFLLWKEKWKTITNKIIALAPKDTMMEIEEKPSITFKDKEELLEELGKHYVYEDN